MAANPNVGADAQSGAGSTPSEPVSPQTPAPIESDVTKMLAEFGGKLDGLGKELRGLQGRQDRAETQYSDFQKQLARYNQLTEKGMKPEEAISEMQRVDADAQWRQTLEQKLDSLAAQFTGAGTPSNGQQAVTKVFESIGLDVKDPRVASALLTKYESADQVELAAYRLSRQIQQSPNPNPAQSPSLPGGNAAGDNQGDLLTKLRELQQSPVKNRKEIAEVEKKLGW
jgi:hypothetical protein